MSRLNDIKKWLEDRHELVPHGLGRDDIEYLISEIETYRVKLARLVKEVDTQRLVFEMNGPDSFNHGVAWKKVRYALEEAHAALNDKTLCENGVCDLKMFDFCRCPPKETK